MKRNEGRGSRGKTEKSLTIVHLSMTPTFSKVPKPNNAWYEGRFCIKQWSIHISKPADIKQYRDNTPCRLQEMSELNKSQENIGLCRPQDGVSVKWTQISKGSGGLSKEQGSANICMLLYSSNRYRICTHILMTISVAVFSNMDSDLHHMSKSKTVNHYYNVSSGWRLKDNIERGRFTEVTQHLCSFYVFSQGDLFHFLVTNPMCSLKSSAWIPLLSSRTALLHIVATSHMWL